MRLNAILLLVCLLIFVAGFFVSDKALESQSLREFADDIQKNLADELSKVQDDIKVITTTETIPPSDKLSYPIFIYEKGRLVYWSDNKFVPPYQYTDNDLIRLYQTGSEAYLLIKNSTSKGREVVSAVMLFRDYPINNDYLTREVNRKIFPTDDFRIYERGIVAGESVCVEGECLFRVGLSSSASVSRRGSLHIAGLALLSLALVLLLVLSSRLAALMPAGARIFFWVLILFSLRFAMIQAGFPANFIDHASFDPQVFASSTFNRSLADLTLNLLVVLFLCIEIFRHYQHYVFQRFKKFKIEKWFIATGSALAILFAMLFPVVVVQTLYNNSAIVLDISQTLHFSALRVIAIFCVLISGICAFLFSHAFVRTLFSIDKGITVKLIAMLAASVIFIGINEYTGQHYLVSLGLTWMYVGTVYVLGLTKTLQRLTFATFAYLFISILFLAANASYTIQLFTVRERTENQFRFASNFLIDRDSFAEYLLAEASLKIAQDAFTQTRIINPFLGKEAIRQKIRQVFLPTYFNKYDVDIYIFNAVGESIDNSSVRLAEMLRFYDQDAHRTDYENVFFVNNPDAQVTQEYLVKIPVQRASIIGYIIIRLSLKRIIPESVYPELLVDYRFQQFYKTPDLSYAVLLNGEYLFSSGEYNFERLFDLRWLGETKLYTKGISHNNYNHIAVEDPSGRIAIVSIRQIPFIYRLSNFSFLLALGLLLILVMIFIQGIYQYFRGERLYFSGRIQLYLNLAFFIPLIIVSITTLSLTSRSSQQQLNEQYLNRSRLFSQQLTRFIDEDDNQTNINSSQLSNRLSELANLSDIDANLYNPWGRLIATSQPLIFESNLLSMYLNANAFVRIKDGENSFIESEKVGKLEYYVAYGVLKSSETGKLFGIIALPFFQSAYSLEKVQIVMLINILNVFAFILIVLLILSYIVADRLTFPLRFITTSLKRTSLTQDNVPLTWHTNDEIGVMVKEYNSMLYKLSESKSELEQTQREKAWREIAQQVAHEIKNPLTPMKLTLQQLQRSIEAGSNSPEKTSKAVSTLLEQVDTLNEIASSFSGFAKMPEPVIQRLDIVSLVRRVVDLHSPTGELVFKPATREAYVQGDEQLLSRTFSNIVLNALQSGIPGQAIAVHIQISIIKGFVQVMIRDNGKGIEPEIAERIFTPHFSTKKSGSGLGLAIARQAIEQMKGKIYFDTKVGKGTAFFVELPSVIS